MYDTYPSSPAEPIYNTSAVLTRVKTVSIYNTQYCISILTVEPFSEDQFADIPFTVSCQTECSDNVTSVCQTKSYRVAGMLIVKKYMYIIMLVQ